MQHKQKMTLLTMTECVTNFTNFRPIPQLHNSTFGSRMHQRRYFALYVSKVSCHEDPTSLLQQMLAQSDQAKIVP
jgi:hypothetical protein